MCPGFWFKLTLRVESDNSRLSSTLGSYRCNQKLRNLRANENILDRELLKVRVRIRLELLWT